MGYVHIKLADLIVQAKRSKNHVCNHCEIQRTQLNNYCNNKVSRVDLSLIARLCKYFNCGVGDILEYVDNENPAETEMGSGSDKTPI